MAYVHVWYAQFFFDALCDKLPKILCIQSSLAKDLAPRESYWLVKPLSKPIVIQKKGEFNSGLEEGFFAIRAQFYVLRNVGQRARVYVLGEEVHVMALSACVKHLELQFMAANSGRFLFSNALHEMLIRLGGIKDRSGKPQAHHLRTRKRRHK